MSISISAASGVPAQQTGAVRANDMSAMSREGVSVSFDPAARGASTSSPLDKMSNGILDQLKAFEQRAAAKDGKGPASALDQARESLMPGPANIRPGGAEANRGPSGAETFENNVTAMVRSFDHAIETQLIVKTGSQFSTSLNSLMRGQ